MAKLAIQPLRIAMPDASKKTDQFELIALTNELALRLKRDVLRMKLWRLFHRTLGILFTVASVVLPGIMVVGLVSYSDTLLSKTILLGITIVSGLNAAFQPYLHSRQRRADMNDSRALLDRYRAAVAGAGEDPSRLRQVFIDASEEFARLYDTRGRYTVVASLSKQEERPGASLNAPSKSKPSG